MIWKTMLIIIVMFYSLMIRAQQFNSDSWIAKPHGTITLIPTVGQRSSMLMSTYSLFPNWEFTYAGYLYNKDNDILTDDGRSTALYAKYMFYQNEEETGGASVKFGTGLFPGFIKGESSRDNAFNTYWVNFPSTIPFFNNMLSWDIMPGVSMTREYGPEKEHDQWGFTYSTRLAYYPFSPKWAAVGEVFGQEGQVYAKPEYKIGVRYEPSYHFNWALTYGQEFSGNEGAGIEIGVMIFTPQFACFSECKPKKK
jgi:hypothetical protein